MSGATRLTVGAMTYRLEIDIAARPDRVWEALLSETNAWWLPDFRVIGPGSTVSLDARAGGHLIEANAQGDALLWYTVHCIQPDKRVLHLVGSVAPDWGGPAQTMLKLEVAARGKGSRLVVVDALHGHVDDGAAESLQQGWARLFTDGLKAHVER